MNFSNEINKLTRQISVGLVIVFFLVCAFTGLTYGFIKASINSDKKYEAACKQTGGVPVFNGRYNECLKGSK